MNKSEARREACAYQETLIGLLPRYRFPNGTTIYCVFGRSELCEKQGLVGEQQSRIVSGLHVYKALNPVKVYSFRFQSSRVLSVGSSFRAYASRGKKIS